MIDIKWLEEQVLLHKLRDSEIELLQSVLRVHHYKPGEEIVSQEGEGGKLYLLRSGCAVISRKEKNKNIVINDAVEGAVFGERSFFSGGKPTATVTAVEKCTVYEIDRHDYYNMVDICHDLMLSLITHILAYTSEVVAAMNMKCQIESSNAYNGAGV